MTILSLSTHESQQIRMLAIFAILNRITSNSSSRLSITCLHWLHVRHSCGFWGSLPALTSPFNCQSFAVVSVMTDIYSGILYVKTFIRFHHADRALLIKEEMFWQSRVPETIYANSSERHRRLYGGSRSLKGFHREINPTPELNILREQPTA